MNTEYLDYVSCYDCNNCMWRGQRDTFCMRQCMSCNTPPMFGQFNAISPTPISPMYSALTPHQIFLPTNQISPSVYFYPNHYGSINYR